MRIRGSLLLSGAALLAGCSGVHVESNGDLRPEETPALTWGWASQAPELDPEQARQLREEVAADLAARGLHEARGTEPDLLVSSSVDVSVRMRGTNEGYDYDTFRFQPMEKFEQGRLTLAFTDPRTGEVRWEGTGRRELRTVSRGVDIASSRFVPTGEPREWDVPDTVRAILNDFPAPR